METWAWLEDINTTRHLVVWLAVLELEREGEYPINAPAIQQQTARMTGLDDMMSERNVRYSQDKLEENDAIVLEEVEEHPGGHHWTVPESARGRQHAEEFTRAVVVAVGSVALCGLDLALTGTPSGACSALF